MHPVQDAEVEQVGASRTQDEEAGTGEQADRQQRSLLSRMWRQLKVCLAAGRPTKEVWTFLPRPTVNQIAPDCPIAGAICKEGAWSRKQ